MKIHMKPPQFDGMSPWKNYLLQFEAAATANSWKGIEKATALIMALRGQATDVLQTLSVEEQADYQQLALRLEMRSRYQKSNESLQQFETDIDRHF